MKTLVLNPLGVHLGYLGCYGNEWIATPNLDRLAAQGVVFDQHMIASPDESLPGLLAGSEILHKHVEAVSFENLVALAKPVLDFLADHDNAIAWIDGPSLAPPWTLPDDLLAAYTEDEESEPWPDPPLDTPLDVEGLARVQDTYAAVVTFFDAQVGRLMDELTSCGLADKVLVIVTSAASFPLGEHGHLGWSRPRLYEEIVHVPLLMRWPGEQYAGLRISALTQPKDLLATLLCLHGHVGIDNEGHNLQDLIAGEVESVRPFAMSTWTVDGQAEAAIRTLDWALLVPLASKDAASLRSRTLYIKPDDRWEANDIASQGAEIADEMEKLLRDSLSNR